MRLFVSVDLPDALAEGVAAVQDELGDSETPKGSQEDGSAVDAPGLNFTDPGQAHVTLKFLGDVPDSRLEALGNALERAAADADVGPFDAAYEGLGVFPGLDYISVVWLGVGGGSAELARLRDAVEAEFVDGQGFEPADHEFTPHVTLARMEHAGGKERVQQVVRERHPEVGTARVSEVRLTESTLGEDGPAYETVRAVEL